jgi:hypothetical protein
MPDDPEAASEEIAAAADAMIELWERTGLPQLQGISWLQLASAALTAAQAARRQRPTNQGPETPQ